MVGRVDDPQRRRVDMTWLIVVIAIVVAVVAVAAAYKWSRSTALRQRFGPEYERVLEQEDGDQRRAHAALRERTKRRAALDIRELTPVAHARYSERWYVVQGHFVDDPRLTLTEAAELVMLVLRERGYRDEATTAVPGATVYDELDLVAVDHPEAVSRFRAAQAVDADGSASTEDARQAFHGYRSLFDAVMLRKDDPDAGGRRDRVIDVRDADRDGAGFDERIDLDDRDDHDRHDRDDRDLDDRAADDGVATDDRDGIDADGDGRDEDDDSGGFLGRFRRQPADHDIR
jgi:hypothetical protein